MPMSNSEARKRHEAMKPAEQVEPDWEYLAAVFRVAWHAADAAGRKGDRVTAGLRAVLGVLEEIR